MKDEIIRAGAIVVAFLIIAALMYGILMLFA